jgi:hypothetical protein
MLFAGGKAARLWRLLLALFMTAASETLVFNAEPWSLTVGGIFVLLVLVLAGMACSRNGWRRATVLLEGLRVVIAVSLAVTLLQPEWQRIYQPEAKPVLALLYDVSRSMETADVQEAASGQMISRAAAAAPLLDEAVWVAVAERFEIIKQPFSSLEEPAEEATDLDAALNGVAENQPQLAAVVLLSDGDRNSGPPPGGAATRLRMRNIPVIAVPIGSETRQPDVELVGFDVPTFAIAGKPLRIPFTLESSLPRDEVVLLEMTVAETSEVITQEVLLPAMARLQEALVWRPKEAGTVRLKLKVPATGGEKNLENNEIEAPLEIRKEQLRVLIVESFPRWEYRYLRNALERDPGVEVNTLLFHPDLGQMGAGRGYLPAFPTEETLTGYDVVFLGDVGVAPDQLSVEQCVTLHKLVRDQATGLVFLPGLRGGQASLWQTPLEELLPVIWDEVQPRGYGSEVPGRFVLTESGTRSLLTKLEDEEDSSARVWSTLPGFQWYAPALRAKAGSEILATHGTETNRFGRVPLIVTKTFGAGKILFMGADGAWRWRRGVEDRYHYRFWGQVVRWMAYQRNMARGEKLRLFYAPDRPRTGGSISLNANVMAMTGEPLREGVVVAQIAAPSGKTTSLRLTPGGEEAWGLFSGSFTATEPGEHQVRLSSADAGEALDTTISVQGTSKEKRGQPIRLDILAEIAQLTRGEVVTSLAPESVLAAIQKIPEASPAEQRVLLWAHPGWAGFLILLLSIFWVGRKAAGTF